MGQALQPFTVNTGKIRYSSLLLAGLFWFLVSVGSVHVRGLQNADLLVLPDQGLESITRLMTSRLEGFNLFAWLSS